MASLEKSTVEDLAKAVASATVEAHRQARQEERPIEHARPSKVSCFNPTGGARPALARLTVFCGAEQTADSLTNEEIELFNQIKQGKYNQGKWQVIVRQDGMDEDTHVEVRIPTQTLDQRMELPSSLVAILQQIVSEGAARKPALATV